VALAMDGRDAVAIVTVTTMLYVEWGRLGEIGDLYVLPQHRGWGIGSVLAAGAADWCRQRGCSAVSVVVTPQGNLRHGLTRFCGRLRFEPSGRTLLYRQL
jgi:GNAT superfamily N-acetyltransferase